MLALARHRAERRDARLLALTVAGLSVNTATVRTAVRPRRDHRRPARGTASRAIAPWRDQVAAVGFERGGARASRDAGLKLSGLLPRRHVPGADAAGRRAALDDNRRAIDEARTLGAPCLVLVVGGLPGARRASRRRTSSARAHMVRDGIAAMLPHARAAPACRWRSSRCIRCMPPTAPASIRCAQALDLCDELDPATGASASRSMSTMSGGTRSSQAQIARAGAPSACSPIHICDWLVPTRDLLLDRGMMGDGVIDLAAIRGWVEAAGYAAHSEVEIFSRTGGSAPATRCSTPASSATGVASSASQEPVSNCATRRRPSPTREGGQIASARSAARFLRHSRFQMDKQGLPSPGSIGEQDLYLFNEGTHRRLYDKLGCHPARRRAGTRFAVWAPERRRRRGHRRLQRLAAAARTRCAARGGSGIWEGFVAGRRARARATSTAIASRTAATASTRPTRSRFARELPPRTALDGLGPRLRVERRRLDGDARRGATRSTRRCRSTRCTSARGGACPTSGNRSLSYRELAPPLADYVHAHGLHARRAAAGHGAPVLRLVGLPDHRLLRADRRYGTPQDFMCLIDTCTSAGIGVILDWVPVALPDATSTASAYFDGTHLYEHADPRQGFHPDWNSCIFNYGRARGAQLPALERAVLARPYHVDGLRVDAVASMLYLDYSRKDGRVDPEPATAAARTSRRSTSCASSTRRSTGDYPDVQTIAEESTAWPMVSRPTYVGGLGFGFKWDMGWMHDTLALPRSTTRSTAATTTTSSRSACSTPSPRTSCCRCRTTRSCTARARCSARCPATTGSSSPTCGCCSATCGRMPGKKLLFMGGEFGQRREWNHDDEPRLAPARLPAARRRAALGRAT